MSNDDIPASRRDVLFAKRELLHAQQAERMAQKEHAENMAHFERRLGATLAQAGVRHEVLWDDDTRRGPLKLYPIGFASVRWDRVPHAVSVERASDEGLRHAFVEALHALTLTPADTVIVDWASHGKPRVALGAADAATHALALIQNASDMWVYAEDAAWLIEVYHEGSVTYADRPGRPEDAGAGWRRFV